MPNFREKVTAFGRSDEERTLLRRMCDLAERADRSGVFAASRFLTPAEQAAAASAGPHFPALLTFDGGFDGAERAVAVFTPYGAEPPARDDPRHPLAALRLTHSQPLGHRDLLGAVMSLGLERPQIGDILPAREEKGPCESALVCLRPNLDFLLASLSRAGRLPVEAHELPLTELRPPERRTERRTVTVASPRLDAVLAAVWHLSREEAQSAVRRGLVSLNHRPEEKPDRELHEGDLLSLRGGGRAAVAEFAGESRRGRLRVVLDVAV